jgi:hypothetical protein
MPVRPPLIGLDAPLFLQIGELDLHLFPHQPAARSRPGVYSTQGV